MAKKFEPTIQQETFVAALLEGKNIKSAAEEAGCDRSRFYQTWRKDPGFLEYMETKRRAVASTRIATVDIALYQKVIKGDVNAMRLFYEVFGGLRNTPIQVNNNITAPEGESPAKLIAQKLDEIEQRGKLRVVKP